MATTRQTSFAGGELSPLLWGRMELELFAHGARRLRNFVVSQQGAAVSRPGTQTVATLPYGGESAVLVPFLHQSGESYLLAFTDRLATAFNTRTLAVAATIVTPYLASELAELQWSQVGNTLLLVQRNHPPQELTAAGTFTLSAAATAPPPDAPGGTPMGPAFPSIGGYPAQGPVLVQWQADTLFVADAEHPPREWRWKVSSILRNIATGQLIETLPMDVLKYANGNVKDGTVGLPPHDLPADGQVVLFPDAPVYLEPGLDGVYTYVPSNWALVETLFYRGRGQLFGLVGRAGPDWRWADFAEEPNYSIPPLRGEAPWRAASGAYPSACGHFGQRRAFAGPFNSFVTSALDQWAVFDEPILPYSGQPLRATLAAGGRENIVGMAELEGLFIFTDTSVWQVGRPETPLDYDTLPSVTRRVDGVGSLRLRPLVVGGAVLWARAQGRGVRALVASQGGLSGVDVSWHAEHLFRGATRNPNATMSSLAIKSWCHQVEPWNALWAVRTDGRLLSCTRTGDGKWAWAQHELGGEVVAVASTPRVESGGALGGWEDLFVVVRRGSAYMLERSTPIEPRGVPRFADDPLYTGNVIGEEQYTYPLDSYSVHTINEQTGTTVTALDRFNGQDVWACCPGVPPLGPLRVAGGSVTIPAGWGPYSAYEPTPGTVLRFAPGTFKAAIGLPFRPLLESLDAPMGRNNQKNVVAVGFEVDSAAGLEVGQDEEHLSPWRARSVSSSYDYPTPASDLVVLNVAGTWNRTARAVLVQTLPVSVTVLGISRQVDVGGE
jgi:hypothetical protein